MLVFSLYSLNWYLITKVILLLEFINEILLASTVIVTKVFYPIWTDNSKVSCWSFFKKTDDRNPSTKNKHIVWSGADFSSLLYKVEPHSKPSSIIKSSLIQVCVFYEWKHTLLAQKVEQSVTILQRHFLWHTILQSLTQDFKMYTLVQETIFILSIWTKKRLLLGC